MDNVALARMLQKGQMTVYTTQQLAVMMGMKINAATVRLNRLVKKGVLVRVMRNRYTLPSADVLAVTSNIYPPSYVSLLAALEQYGVTTQSPRVIDVVNLSRSGKLSLALDSGRFEVHFLKVNRSLMYGYNKIFREGKTAMIAEKEKVIVDSLLFSEYVSLDDIVACIDNDITCKRAIDYARRTGRQTVMKRLGYLLSTRGLECSPDDFSILSRTYIPLDPRQPRRGRYDPTWRVIVNRVIE